MNYIDLHGISCATLIGQSMGGNLAQEIIYRKPGLVSGMILIDCTRNTGKLTPLEKYMLKLTKPIFYFYPWATLINQSAKASANKEEVRAYIRECFNRMKKRDIIDIISEVMGVLHEDEDYRFPIPILLLCGTDDTSGNIKKIVGAWARSDPNCLLQMISDAGHCSNQDNPEEVNRAISGYLKNHEVSGG